MPRDTSRIPLPRLATRRTSRLAVWALAQRIGAPSRLRRPRHCFCALFLLTLLLSLALACRDSANINAFSARVNPNPYLLMTLLSPDLSLNLGPSHAYCKSGQLVPTLDEHMMVNHIGCFMFTASIYMAFELRW